MFKRKSHLLTALVTYGIGLLIASISLTNLKPATESTNVLSAQPSETNFSSIKSEMEIQRPDKTSVFTIAAASNSSINIKKPIVVIKNGGLYCEDYLVKQIAKNKAKDSRIVELKNFDADSNALTSGLKVWFQPIRKDSFAAFELRNKEKKIQMFHSIVLGATSLAANFESWYINIDNQPVEFISLSQNPSLIFWDKDGFLNYYVIDYGDAFMESKDYENLTVDLDHYKITPAGEFKLINKKENVQCE